MFDIGWQELFILAVLAIIVIGPKDLPRAIKTVTQWIRKARTMARDLQDGLDDVVREAELDDIKAEANKIMDGDGIDPTGTMMDELDMGDVQKDWADTVDDLKTATDPNAKKETDQAEPVESAALDDDPALAPQPEESVATETETKPAEQAKG